MPDLNEAGALAEKWIAAWNGRDLEAILAHYHEDVIYTSPFAIHLGASPDGDIRGKAALRPYIAAGLDRFPELCFELRHVFAGAKSIVIEYDSVNELVAAETLVLNPEGMVVNVFCHYRHREQESPQP